MMSTATMLPDSLNIKKLITCNNLSCLSEPLSMIDIHMQLQVYLSYWQLPDSLNINKMPRYH